MCVFVGGSAGSNGFREEHTAVCFAAPHLYWWTNVYWRSFFKLCLRADMEEGLWRGATGKYLTAEHRQSPNEFSSQLKFNCGINNSFPLLWVSKAEMSNQLCCPKKRKNYHNSLNFTHLFLTHIWLIPGLIITSCIKGTCIGLHIAILGLWI